MCVYVCGCGCFGVLLLCVVFVFVVCVLCACDLLIVENMAGSVSVTLLADAGVYPDWAKVGASDSAPSDGSTLGETAISETAYDDLVGDDDSDNSY